MFSHSKMIKVEHFIFAVKFDRHGWLREEAVKGNEKEKMNASTYIHTWLFELQLSELLFN